MPLVLVAAETEVYHGVSVEDHFRWLEDRNSEPTSQWLAAQAKAVEAYFGSDDQLTSAQDEIRSGLDLDIVDQPVFAGGRYFYRRRLPGDPQPSICVCDADRSHEQVLINPLAAGSEYSVSLCRVSDDGRFVAYELRHGGEDRSTIRFVEAPSGLSLPDTIPHGRHRGLVFSPDGDGYYYCQDVDAEERRIQYHAFGEASEGQTLLAVPAEENSRLILIGDGVRLGAVWMRGAGEAMILDLWIRSFDLEDQWALVCSRRKTPFCPFLSDGRIFATDYSRVPNGELLQFEDGGVERAVMLKGATVSARRFALLGRRVFLQTNQNGSSQVDCWSLGGGAMQNILSSSEGSFRLLPRLSNTAKLFVKYESFVDPGTIYEVDAESGTMARWHPINTASSSARIAVSRSTYASKDGTEIAITIVRSRNGDGSSSTGPCIMTSYGGFGVSMQPRYSVFVNAMLRRGATFVMPHIRGGGEGGSSWHEAGRRRLKRNAFDDFIAAAEWLCQQAITTPRQLGIFGGSNSGLLVAVAMTQRPELFGAVLCIAPLLDMVRYEKLDHAAPWVVEYGTVDEEEEFLHLLSYSPYHQVHAGTSYPAILLVAGDRDERCNPAHARKMAAQLLEVSTGTRPILLDHDSLRGHRPTLPFESRVEAVARRVRFFCRELEITPNPGALNDQSRD